MNFRQACGTGWIGVSLLIGGCVDMGTEPMLLRGGGAGVSFQLDILPILTSRGCTTCHGGNGGLFVGSVQQLLQGGQHGPAVTPGDAAGSLIIRKLSPTPPFGDRMPRGGPYLDDATIQVIRTWIDHGAANN